MTFANFLIDFPCFICEIQDDVDTKLNEYLKKEYLMRQVFFDEKLLVSDRAGNLTRINVGVYELDVVENKCEILF